MVRQRKTTGVMVAAIVLSAALVLLWGLKRASDATQNHELNADADLAVVQAEKPSTSRPNSTGTTAELPEDQGSARQYQEFEANTFAKILGISLEPFEEAETEFAERLVRLEAGDEAEAIEFSELRMRCRRMLLSSMFRSLMTTGSHDAIVAQLEEKVAGRETTDERFERIRLEVDGFKSTIPQCIPFLAQGDQALRDILETWAESGNVAARYVYAVSAPHRDIQLPTLDEIRHWEVRAIEFSLENLNAGEALGFEAFAHSYEASSFTPGNRLLSFDFRMAAFRCGLTDSTALRKSLGTMVHSRAFKAVPPSALALVISRSEQLRPYCRSGQWVSADVVSTLDWNPEET